MPTRLRTPSYRHHKPSGQAVVTLDGKDLYLGQHGAQTSRDAYDRLVAEWLANGRRLPSDASNPSCITINELFLAYWNHAQGFYVKDGQPTSELSCTKQAARHLTQHYGSTQASDFGPLRLKAVRAAMIDANPCRNVVNRHIARLKQMFKWAVEHELVAPDVYHRLAAVAGLRKGRSSARETDPVHPVSDDHIDAVKPYLSVQVWAAVQLQRLTGMRSGEVGDHARS